MWRRMYIYTEEEKKKFERKTQKQHLQPGLFVKFWGRIKRWYTDEYLLKEQRVVVFLPNTGKIVWV